MNGYLVVLKIGAAVGLVLAIFATGHHYGAAGVTHEWTADKLVQSERNRQAIESAVRDNDAKHAKNIKLNGELLAIYEARHNETNALLDRARADADRVRLAFTRAKPACPAASGQATSAGLPDAGGTEEVELPATLAANLRAIADDADREVTDLRTKLALFREWARKQGFAPTPGA